MKNIDSKTEKIDDDINADPILITQYSSEASQLIKSITRNIRFIVLVLIIIASMTILDLGMDLGLSRILADEIIDAMIIGVSILLILFIIFTLGPVLRSKKILEKWSNLFEKNAIRTSIMLTINSKNKEEILHALSQTITQIALPLQEYLAKSNHNEFYNITVDGKSFDILIDKSTIKSINSNSLIKSIEEYGSILIKIGGVIDKIIAQGFIEALENYKKTGNKIGLAIIIGEEIEEETYGLFNKIEDKTIGESLILIETPNNTKSDLKKLDDILT